MGAVDARCLANRREMTRWRVTWTSLRASSQLSGILRAGSEAFQAIPDRRVSPATSNRPLSGSTYWMTVDDHANLARGDRVELDGHPGLSAMVTDISGGGICVWFDTPVRHDTLPAQGSLRRSFDDRLYRMQMQAIAALREGNAVNCSLIRALADRTFLPLNPHSSAPLGISLAFDQYQLEAIRRASQVRDFLRATSPPGTGRTRTTSEIVGQSVRKGERVLVVGATNIGVDSLLQRLRDEIVMVCVGSSDFLYSGMKRNTIVVDPQSAAEASSRIAVEQADVVAGHVRRCNAVRSNNRPSV